MTEPKPSPLRDDAPWYAVYTNIRCEFRAYRGLKAKGFDVFFPTYEKQVGRHGRKKHMKTCPTLSRYVFVAVEQIGANNFREVRSTDGVESILTGSDGEPVRIPPEMLAMIRAVDKFGDIITDERIHRETIMGVEVGGELRVTEGPFAGFIGIIQKIGERKDSVDILISIFGRKTPIKDIDIENLSIP